MMGNRDLSEHTTGNLLVALKRPVEAVTPELLRSLLPEAIPIPFTLRKTGLSVASGPTIVQLARPFGLPPFMFESEIAVVEPERFVYLPPHHNDAAALSDVPTWGIIETGVASSSKRGAGIAVAVLDSGLDFQHPDFLGRVRTGDWIDLTGTGIDDLVGHGTYCAGIACGPVKPTGRGRYGVAAEARLLIGKIFDVTQTRCPDFTVLTAILWAARRGADIISLSWGLPTAPDTPHSKVYEFVAELLLESTRTIIVAASGNASQRPLDPRPIYHPADCPPIMAVAGLDIDLTVARFSCGKVSNQRQPSLAAPAIDVVSAVPRQNRPADPYSEEDGTSAAAAFVAGIAALWAEESGARGRDLRNLVATRVRAIAEPADDVGSGLSTAP